MCAKNPEIGNPAYGEDGVFAQGQMRIVNTNNASNARGSVSAKLRHMMV